MTPPKTLCRRMTARTAIAQPERCPGAVAAHVAGRVIGDTGSTDGAPDAILGFLAALGVRGERRRVADGTGGQARNAAPERAPAAALVYDRALPSDADIELVAEDADLRAKPEARGHDPLRRTGIGDWNAGVVRRDPRARDHGASHADPALPGGGGRQRHGVWYKDHATGAGRADMVERGVRLRLGGFEQEPPQANPSDP